MGTLRQKGHSPRAGRAPGDQLMLPDPGASMTGKLELQKPGLIVPVAPLPGILLASLSSWMMSPGVEQCPSSGVCTQLLCGPTPGTGRSQAVVTRRSFKKNSTFWEAITSYKAGIFKHQDSIVDFMNRICLFLLLTILFWNYLIEGRTICLPTRGQNLAHCMYSVNDGGEHKAND